MLIMTNNSSGRKMEFECTKQAIGEYALANAEMLLQIALGDSDERIDIRFGGEKEILDCIERYLKIYDWSQEVQ